MAEGTAHRHEGKALVQELQRFLRNTRKHKKRLIIGVDEQVLARELENKDPV